MGDPGGRGCVGLEQAYADYIYPLSCLRGSDPRHDQEQEGDRAQRLGFLFERTRRAGSGAAMISAKKTCDVFISHAAVDAPLAADIANACHANGLDATASGELAAGDDAYDALWEALAESRAVLVVLPSTGATASMSVEIGAARAWN